MNTRLLGPPSCSFGFTCHVQRASAAAVRLRVPPARAADTSSSQSVARLRAVLEQVDGALSQGNDEAALSLVRGSQGKDGGLRGFCAARQVPQRLYTLDELKLNGIDTSAFLSPVDQTLGSIERNLQIGMLLGGLSISYTLELSQLQILFVVLGLLSLWSVDFVYFGGGMRNLVLDTVGHYLSQKYHNRVIQHEAGHFLIAYLLGVLPKEYTITSLDTLIKQGSLNVQAGTAFVDYEFLEEINTGKLSATVRVAKNLYLVQTGRTLVWDSFCIIIRLSQSISIRAAINEKKMLNKFSCIALAGVSTEYLLYGMAEGGLADINKLDGLLRSLGFTQKKADSQVRWAVLNTVLMLRRHEKARLQLAEAMSSGKSVGSCIEVIEENINIEDI